MVVIKYNKKANKNQRWLVQEDIGKPISRHRKKSAAKRSAKRAARKRDTKVKVNNVDGTYYYINNP